MLTQEKFIQKANVKHGGKYTYERAIYTKSLNKLTITCPKHGDFEQTAHFHLAGQGCKKCSMEKLQNCKRVGTDRFKVRASLIHHNKYNYDKVVYTHGLVKVVITCPDHGDFEQLPSSHLQGYGCSICANLVRFKNLGRYDQNEFLEKVKKVHGNRYGYDRAVFIDGKTKIIITCPKHGDFEQKPSLHLKGHGCQKCSGIVKLTVDDFIKQAKIIHGEKYSYHKFIYTTVRQKSIITCPTHGDFEQRARNHLAGQGCPVCKASKGEIRIKAILDKNNINYIQEYVIPGVTPRYRYDFYLPDHGIFIEFHGGQHFKPVKFFGGEDAFRDRILRDKIKKSILKTLGRPLIELNFMHLRKMSKADFEATLLKKIRKSKAPNCQD